MVKSFEVRIEAMLTRKLGALNLQRRWAKFVAAVALLVTLVLGYHWYIRHKAVSLLPLDLGVESVSEATFEPGFPEWLLFGNSGFFLYKLDDQTVVNLERSGLSYLRSASMPRTEGRNIEPRSHYQAWESTPLPTALTAVTPEGRGLWSGLIHARFSPAFEAQVLEAATSPGSYYSSNAHGDMLLVMPKLRVAIFTWVR